MPVKTAFCALCQRTAYLGEDDDLRCPVCASPLVNTDTDEERAGRIGRNESLFRNVNERIEKITQGASGPREREAFVCECGTTQCSALVQLSFDEYEAIRAHPARFAVIPGHELAEVERVVEDHGTYYAVEKIGAGRAVAEAEDPRSSGATPL